MVGAVLRTVHDIWIHQIESYTSSAVAPEATFWNRWTAVRYLADEFQSQYQRERALLEELGPFLSSGAIQSLAEEADRILQLHRLVDSVGRRRGTAKTLSVFTRKLLDAVLRWCGDFELTTGEISRDSLGGQAQQVLAELERYSQNHR
jgi:hypothetical protein